MNVFKHFLLKTGIYVLFTFFLAYIWNMVLFRDIYLELASDVLRSRPLMHVGIAAVVIEGAVLSILFSKFYQPGYPVREGALVGLLVGAFSISYAGLVVPAKFLVDPVLQYTTMEMVFGVVHFSIAGVLLGFTEEHIRKGKLPVASLAHTL